MAIRDDSGPFMPVGRIALGRAVLVYDTWTVQPEAHVTIPIRGPRGGIEPFIATGDDLPAAVAAALQSLSMVPFAIAACTMVRPRDDGRGRAATVLVRSRDAARPRYTTGHATAADDATAVASSAAVACPVVYRGRAASRDRTSTVAARPRPSSRGLTIVHAAIAKGTIESDCKAAATAAGRSSPVAMKGSIPPRGPRIGIVTWASGCTVHVS